MAQLVYAITLGPPPVLPTVYRRDLDPKLEAICLKAMAREPEFRYPTMAAFAVALEKWLRASLLRSTWPPRRMTRTRTRTLPPPVPWRRLFTGLLSFLVVVGLGVGGAVWRSARPMPRSPSRPTSRRSRSRKPERPRGQHRARLGPPGESFHVTGVGLALRGTRPSRPATTAWCGSGTSSTAASSSASGSTTAG